MLLVLFAVDWLFLLLLLAMLSWLFGGVCCGCCL